VAGRTHGWAALVRKLRPGEHTITVVVTDSEGVTTTGNIFVEIVLRGHNHGDHGRHGDDRHYGDD
jgi:hypothetical protein